MKEFTLFFYQFDVGLSLKNIVFIEPLIHHSTGHGWIEVIAGPMFSGKTEELIRRLKRAKIANMRVTIFKPSVDKRYSDVMVVSHDANMIPSILVDRAIEIIDHFDDADVIGIDEAQFLNTAIVDVAQYLANKGKRVIIAGLDMDSNGKPFGPVPELMAVAEFVTKLHAICIDCGSLASHSFRLVPDDEVILVGSQDKYKPLCRKCFSKLFYQEFNINE
jgi:thymidine kinase